MVCEACGTGAKLSGTPVGGMHTVGKYQTYLSTKATVAPGADGSTKAILILPDIFGLGIVNPKLTADMLNEKVGCDVYVPDTFEGECPRASRSLS